MSHKNLEAVRRLLRFGGETFAEFLHSLDELPGRSLLAVPELTLPALDLQEYSAGNFTLKCTFDFPGHGHVLVGVLRAMADDYGALAVLEHMGSNGGCETIFIQLTDTQFSNGRSFNLSVGAH
ncbi:MAG: heme NO-binding domain-containing protein [Paracoccaceae bacterium]